MTERMDEDAYKAEKQKAINALEDALRRSTEVYAHGDSPEALERHEQMFLQAWVGVSSWSGVDADGIPTSKVVIHLNDFELPAWQIMGLLRAAMLESEKTYTGAGSCSHDSED